MSENSKIEWTDHTFNPWIGCTKVSPGCDHCYAEADWDLRKHRVRWGAGNPRSRTSAANWGLPLRWNRQYAEFFQLHWRRQRVFCASLADVFDNEVPEQWRRDLFALIDKTPHLDWLLLTKRIGNAERLMRESCGFLEPNPGCFKPRPNVWIGATIVNQVEADRDIPKLLAVPARVRFMSCEPLLGPIDLHRAHDRFAEVDAAVVDWVIAGGESGHGARPMNADWARSLRAQCAAAGVPFLFKQWGEFLPADANEVDPSIPDVSDSKLFWSDGTKWDRFDGQRGGVHMVARVGKKAAGRLLDGREHNGFPEAIGP